MTSFQSVLQTYLCDPEDLTTLATVLDAQAAETFFGTSLKLDATTEWANQQSKIVSLLAERTDSSITRALKILAKLVDTLEIYAPALKGLGAVHAFATEKLEVIVFDSKLADAHIAMAAYLYGQAMAMYPVTSEALSPAVDDMLLRGDATSANLALCVLLGIQRSNEALFENFLPIVLRQVQVAAFTSDCTMAAREALLSAMGVYSPTEKAASCSLLLQSVHALLVESLSLCKIPSKARQGVIWSCFILEHTPMTLRADLQNAFPQTCDAGKVFSILSSTFPQCSKDTEVALCGALPILVAWSTQEFVAGTQIEETVEFMLSLPEGQRRHALLGLGQLASVVLDRIEPFMDTIAQLALDTLKDDKMKPKDRHAAQVLLGKLLAAMGPVTLDAMVAYLRLPPSILLANVNLLQMIAALLPNLSRRIITSLSDIIDDLMAGRATYEHEAVLAALNAFPLVDPELAVKAQCLVLWSLDEEKGKSAVMAALQLCTNPHVARSSTIQSLTFRAAQLLLADDAHIVHLALNVLSNPSLASMLDEQSCSMILLALHQSLEPSIQIVAAKLLTHLTTAHRAIVQPLAWSHIRQSLSLMDFLKSVDPSRAIIEACIVSNLLPALPSTLHKKYVGPVKSLILSGLQRPQEGNMTLSLVFQGLANLAKFEGWGSRQQSELAMDLLDMTSEIPKDSQHAALNAISRLLSVPTEGLDVYDILVRVHATFGGRGTMLDADLKSLVSGIYGHLGTVERNPVISRDSKAAINRETSVYTLQTIHLGQVAEIRDKHGAHSQTHINWLVTKNLISALSPAHKTTDERALVLEIMISLGILQPSSIPALIPDLPRLIFAELKGALHPKDGHRETTPVPAAILFLASALHISPLWLHQYWNEAAEMMADALREGHVLPVLRGLGVILDAVIE